MKVDFEEEYTGTDEDFGEQAVWSSAHEFGQHLRNILDEYAVAEEGSDAPYDLETMNQALGAFGFKLEVEPLRLIDDAR